MNGYLYWLAAGRIMVRLLRGKIIFQSHDSLGRFDSIYGKLCERSRFFFFFSFSGWQSEMSICFTGFIMINSVKKDGSWYHNHREIIYCMKGICILTMIEPNWQSQWSAFIVWIGAAKISLCKYWEMILNFIHI